MNGMGGAMKAAFDAHTDTHRTEAKAQSIMVSRVSATARTPAEFGGSSHLFPIIFSHLLV